MKTHELKTDPAVFDEVAAGRKTYELRKDDRGFEVGDTLRLRKTRYTGAEMARGAELEYTGDEEMRTVSHVLRGPIYGLAEGWAILSMALPPIRRHLTTMESRSHNTLEPVVDAVCRKQRERAAFGLGKYGKTMDREDLSMVGWATHFQEEAMDAANYAERLIRGGHLLEEAIALLAPRAGEPAVAAWLLEVARNFGEMFAHPAVASCEPVFGQITRDSDGLYFRHDFEEYEEDPKGPQDEYHDCQDMLRRIGWEIADPQIEHDCISGKLARYKSP